MAGNKMQKTILVAVATLVLVSCASQPQHTQHTMNDALFVQVHPAPTLVNGGAGSETNIKVGAQIAGPKTYIPPLPTAVVILKDPDGDLTQATRNQEFCQSFRKKIPEFAGIIESSTLAQNVIATRWLVDVNSATSTQHFDCPFLLSNYDFQRAGLVMGSIPLGSQKPIGKTKTVSWSDPGPFIVELFPDSHVAIADASDVNKQEDFDKFMVAWLDSAVAQQQAIEGDDASTVAATASGTASGTTPSAAATAAASGATKVASSNSLALGKDAYGIATFLLGLIPAVAPFVKVATTVIGDVCKVVGTG